MFDFWIRQKWTERQRVAADVSRNEYRRNPHTSGSAHLDDMIACEKAVILCDECVRKFRARAVRYELHPSPNLRRVFGICDRCKVQAPGTLFLPESLSIGERRKEEDFRRAREYAGIAAS